MRAISAPALAILQGKTFDIYTKCEVRNVDETWVDLTSRFVSADVSVDVDQNTWTVILTFVRDDPANTASLSPLRSDSTLNVDDSAAYAPIVTAGNQFRLNVACVASGATPTTPDYHELIIGTFDTPSFAGNRMTVAGRDLGGRMVDTTVTERVTYGDPDDPTPVADVMQQVLDDVLGEGEETLEVVDASDFTVTDYTPLNVPVMESMQALAIKAGGLVARYKYDDDGVMKFSMYDPVRDKTVADVTLTPSRYIEIPTAALDITNLRNWIRGQFVDPVTGELLTLEVKDTDSIAAFGPRFMQIGSDVLEGLDGNKVLEVITAALNDLSTPKFDHQVERFLFWPAELGDLILWSANDVHYNDDQPLAVVGIRHFLEQAKGRTTFTCRGKPAGAYNDWIRRQGTGPTGPQIPPAPELLFLVGEGAQFGGTSATVDGAIWIGYKVRWSTVDEIRLFVLLGDGSNLGVPGAEATTATLPLRKPEGDPGDVAEYSSIALLSTDENYWKRVRMEGVKGGLSSKPVIPAAVQAVDPIPMPVEGTVASLVVERNGSENIITVTPGTLEPTIGANHVCIICNKHILPPIPIGTSTDPVVFVHRKLEPSASAAYAYEAFIANIGETWLVSGPKRLTVVEGPTTVAPVFVNNTPILASVGGFQRVQIDWTGATPSATGVRVEATLDQVTVRVVGTGDLASDTVYDTQLGPKFYRLVAFDGSGDLAFSPWQFYATIQGPLSNPSAVPQFVNGTPKPVLAGTGFTGQLRLGIDWKCATPGASVVVILLSTTGSGGTYTAVPGGTSAAVSSGSWKSPNGTYLTTEAWYKIEARALDLTTVLATSTIVHYVPPS